ncbi:Hypothetical predicted protein [Pelobates cultripes]|uniref:Uncharacterized protein n=1 Tax=Pelobates cultripes TaxID=61616 RepID=A0AAD1RNT5_PELCU|nr:Hypothetical predicted protein [Pelobates cultripes]
MRTAADREQTPDCKARGTSTPAMRTLGEIYTGESCGPAPPRPPRPEGALAAKLRPASYLHSKFRADCCLRYRINAHPELNGLQQPCLAIRSCPVDTTPTDEVGPRRRCTWVGEPGGMPLRCPWGPLAGCRDPWTVPCGDRSAVTCGFEEDLQATVPDAVSPRGVERGGPVAVGRLAPAQSGRRRVRHRTAFTLTIWGPSGAVGVQGITDWHTDFGWWVLWTGGSLSARCAADLPDGGLARPEGTLRRPGAPGISRGCICSRFPPLGGVVSVVPQCLWTELIHAVNDRQQ